MIMYVIAIPVFTFCLPLYSFWHMDDFSWGNTRVVTGEKGQKIVISDEGKFDPSEIPRKKWEDYQAGLWGEAGTQRGFDDTRSEMSGYSYATKSYHPAMSEFGYSPSHQAPPMPGSRPMSTLNLPGQNGRSMSRMSLAPSELMSQRGSQMYDPAGMEMSSIELPSDDAIVAEIKDILRTADLMNVTKKSIKRELEARFGVSLDAKRVYVNTGK
jgi:chitin synthase